MPPDPTPLALAAKRRSEHAHVRAGDALRELDKRGGSISFQAVARQAGVSRQWLYQQPELRAEIERLRGRRREQPGPVPAAERASDASLRQRLETLLEENRRLRAEVADLKTELALAYGQQRADPDAATTS
jgi:hypothetical protein